MKLTWFWSLLFFLLVCREPLSSQVFPTHVWPKDKWVTDQTTVQFQWNYFSGAVTYDLQIAEDSLFTVGVQNFTSLSLAQHTVTTLSTSMRYFWKVKADNSGWSTPTSFHCFIPSQLPGLMFWFHADSSASVSGTEVTSWQALLSGPNAVQNNPVNRPQLITSNPALNNHRTIRFDGVGSSPDYLLFPSQNSGLYTIFTLRNYQSSSNPVQYFLGGTTSGLFAEGNALPGGFGQFDGSNILASSTSALNPNFSIYTHTNSAIKRNGIVPSIAYNQPTGLLQFSCIGTRPDVTQLAFRGDIAQIIGYNSALSASNQFLVQEFLRYYYQPPVNLGRDILAGDFCSATSLNAGPGYSSYLWSTGATTPGIIATEAGTYWVTVTDVFNFTSTDTIQITGPYVFNQIPNDTICLGDGFTWNTNYPAGYFTFLWSDNSTADSLVITTAGNYWVEITDTNGCSFYSDTITIAINNFPNASLGPDTSLCSGNRISLDMPGGPGATYLWSTGSTDSIALVSTSQPYHVHATNSIGCVADDTVQVTISGIAPVANFSVQSPCISSLTTFTDLSNSANGIVGWKWKFGDGDSSALQNPGHIFPFTGNYNVTLQVTSGANCINDTVIPIYISPYPNADFSVNNLCERSPLQLTDLSSSSVEVVNDWFWDFGDFSSTTDTASGPSPYFEYPNSGNYDIRLVVRNNYGCPDTASQIVSIAEGPASDFSYNKTCYDDPVQFTNLTSVGGGLSIISYRWYFSPTDSSVVINPRFRFMSLDAYPVQLISTASNGCKNIKYDTLVIDKFVHAGYETTNDTLCRYVSYPYLDTSLAYNTTITNWSWTFDNNGTSSAQNPDFTFNEAGLQQVRLIVTSADNCTDTIVRPVRIKTPPTAAFSVNQQVGFPPLNLTATNTSSSDAIIFNWDLGNGVQSNLEDPPTVQYPDTGSYQVVLIVRDAIGCSDTASRTITVVRPQYNVLLQNLQCTETNGYMEFSTTLLNQGNIALNEIDWRAGLNNSYQLQEIWTGNLGSGQFLPFTFSGNILLIPETKLCCVKVSSVSSALGDSTMNEQICAPIQTGFAVLNPWPNPSSGLVNIYYILPIAGQVDIRISDINGKLIEIHTLNGTEGVNLLQTDLSSLQSGIYHISFYFRDQIITRKLFRI